MARSYIKKATRLNNGVTLGTAILPFGRYAAMQRYEKISNLQTNFKQNARKHTENHQKHPPRHRRGHERRGRLYILLDILLSRYVGMRQPTLHSALYTIHYNQRYLIISFFELTVRSLPFFHLYSSM